MSKYFVLERRCILTLDVFESLSERVRKEIMNPRPTPRLPEIACAASLAHHGLLGSVRGQRSVRALWMCNIDLTSVPAEHLASLASSVTGCVSINNVSGCDLVTVLDSMKSQLLSIRRQSLGREETQALVLAMESRVERVGLNEHVTLDIRSLIEYNGQGKCRDVVCYSNTAQIYREQLRTWAMSRNWTLHYEDRGCFSIKRL